MLLRSLAVFSLLSGVLSEITSQEVEYDVDKAFGAEDFECVDVGAQGTLTKIAIDVNMQMLSSSWASDFFIAVYDPVNETGRQLGGDSSFSFQSFITDRVTWDSSLETSINGNVAEYADINPYTVKATDQVCYGNGFQHGDSMTVGGKIVLTLEIEHTDPPSMQPTSSPRVEYGVDNEAFGALEFKCVGVGAHGTLNKIAIDVNMQMTSSSWASDFFIVVHDPVAETGRQVGSEHYLFKPYITNAAPWDDSLDASINGDVVSYVNISEYPVKSTDLMCYGNGFPHGGNMAVHGKIVLFDLVEGGPINPTMDPTSSSTLEPTLTPTMEPTHAATIDPTHTPTLLPTYSSTMEPTHSSTMEPTYSVMPTLYTAEVEYDVDNKVFGALEYECVDVGAYGTLNKIAINVNMQMTFPSYASDFSIAVYDPVDETGRQVGGYYPFKPYITNKTSWGVSLQATINGNVASYVDIYAYTVKPTAQVCYGNSYQNGKNMTVDGHIVLSNLVESDPTDPPSMEPTHPPTMGPTQSMMPTVYTPEVEYDVDRTFAPLQFECVGVGAYGALNKIAIDANMQMNKSSYASDFFIAVVDPVAETGRQVGGYDYLFKPFITNKTHWDASLDASINGAVVSYVNISEYPVKSTDLMCYGNGYHHGGNMAVHGRIVLSDLVESQPSSSPSMEPTHSPTTVATVVPTYTPSMTSTPVSCMAKPKQVGNGVCNKNGKNNVESCMWDGGDCCEQSCLNNPDPKYAARCGRNGYQCLDPAFASSPTVAPGQEECTAPKPHSVGNGVCNHNNGKNNVADCGWDGGDCCEESCLDNANPKHVKRCGMRGYHCLDPAYANSPTAAPGPAQCLAKPKQLGNGICNKNGKNNKAECGWDGGDCCEVSCLSNPNPKKAAKCGNKGYQCLDPQYVV